MGMMQSRNVATHPENFGKSKSEMKPNEMAMMRAVARLPRTGCLRPDKALSFHAAQRSAATAAAMSIAASHTITSARSSKIVESHARHQAHPLPARFLGR